MEENPFGTLVEAIRREAVTAAPTGLVMGKVLTWPSQAAPMTPHKILAGGNTQERGALRANPTLLPYGLTSGDEVLLLPIEEAQRYIILCKVVDV